MGLMKWLFGGGARQVGNVVEQIGGVFRPNAEASARRSHDYESAALGQYAAEFHRRSNRTWIDSLADGLNRLVRPLVTLAVIGVLPAVMVLPEQSAIAFAALALLPTGYWALVSVIIPFYFGGRMQMKAQDFRASIDEAVARAPAVIDTMERLRDHLSPGVAADEGPELALEIAADLPSTDNRAVAAWRAKQSG